MKRTFATRRSLFALAVALPLAAHAEIRLPNALSDHAVLQRERPIHIWGWATPGAQVSAHFHNQTVAAITDNVGEWNLWLAPETAGGPYTLTLSGDGTTKSVSDLLIGDVWLASGQSNMEFPLAGFGPTMPLKNQAQEIADSANPKLRLLVVDHKSSDFPVNDVSTTWTTCTPETARRFSAVAYFFGREIAAKENVPIGLIDTSWGGTPVDSWISLDTLGTNPDLLSAFANRARFSDRLGNVDAVIAEEKGQDAAALAAGKPAPKHPYHPPETSWLPAGLYNGMIAPFAPMSIKGFLWYQGETDSGPGRAAHYESLFSAMIGDWRTHFAQGLLPFFYVQISSFNSPAENWGAVRDAQRRTLHIANTAMAVTLDVGQAENVHPPDKQTVAARLALAARDMVYGEKLEYQSPLFREATTELAPDGTVAMRVWFDHSAGLTYRGQAANGFELAGADRKFVRAQARIEGETVLVSAPTLPKPMYVRYNWMGVIESNLYNAAGLPASTFTSEPPPALNVQ